MKKKNSLVGKNVIVRANVAGVHAGTVTDFDPATQTVVLKNARRLWRFYTRDASGSISDIAANGLKSGAEHQIGVKLLSVTITNPSGLEVAEMTKGAYKSLMDWKN
jgi:hypothetical protein